MKKVFITLLAVVLAGMAPLFMVFSQDKNNDAEAEFIFRSQDRPEYKKNVSLEQLKELQDTQNIALIDVRLAEDFALDPILIPGAEYKDPENISKWVDTLPKDKKIILYCVKGAWVSQKAATYLNEKGYDVSSLNGGLRDWKKATNK